VGDFSVEAEEQQQQKSILEQGFKTILYIKPTNPQTKNMHPFR
jgi:hypothetical protein